MRLTRERFLFRRLAHKRAWLRILISAAGNSIDSPDKESRAQRRENLFWRPPAFAPLLAQLEY